MIKRFEFWPFDTRALFEEKNQHIYDKLKTNQS